MGEKTPTSTREPQLARVLAMMATCLDILDDNGAPADIGAHLDLARSRLLQHLGRPDETEA
jgi:hypothetical protein